MRDISVRPFRPADAEQLDLFRWRYEEADLEVPHGYMAPGVETLIAEKEGKFVLALTATLAIILDPLIRAPGAANLDIASALFKAEAVLTYLAQANGAVDAYIAIPDALADYQKMLQRAGYVPTVQACTVFRKPLRKETMPLIGPIRDKMALEQAAKTAETANTTETSHMKETP